MQAHVVTGQASPAGDVELPTVQIAGEHAVLDVPEPREVGTHVRAATLHQAVAEPPQPLVLLGQCQPFLDVADPVGRQALEEHVDVVVVRAGPLRAEAAGQEQPVDPVLTPVAQVGADERVGDLVAVSAGQPVVRDHPLLDEIDDDPLALGCQQHPVTDAGAQPRCRREHRIPPLGELRLQQVAAARPGRPLGVQQRPGALLVSLEVAVLVPERLGGIAGVRHGAVGAGQLGGRAGNQQLDTLDLAFPQVVDEDGLVGERVSVVLGIRRGR